MMIPPVMMFCMKLGICKIVSPFARTARMIVPTNVPTTHETPLFETVQPINTAAYACRKYPCPAVV